MKIAVTGASGFVGKHVLAALRTHDAEIYAVTRDASRLSNRIDSSIRIVEMDIYRPAANAFEQLGCPDVLIHLAWDGLPNYKSLHHFETEMPRQYNFLKGLVESGLPSMLVTGTCFEYGMQSGKLSEDMLAQPNNPYGYAKNALRQQLQFLQSTRPFELTWARLFYMYGEGQAASSLYSQLKAAALRGDKLFNMSGGEQLRDYLPIEEVSKLIVDLCMHPNGAGLVNLCNGHPISIRRLVEGWVKTLEMDIELNLGHYPYPDYEPMAFWGDRNKIEQTLGLLAVNDQRYIP